MIKSKKIIVKNISIGFISRTNEDYISITDIARYKGVAETDDVIKNWMRNRGTIEFLGLWEKINNPAFKPVEFDGFRNEAGSNHFVLSPSKWIHYTNAIGIITRQGRNGGTFAHKDIAFEFASWISAEFKLFLIKEFQRLKEEENERLRLGWDVKRTLARINYRVHTDAIKANLIPPYISKSTADVVYASEADVLNMALFGKTAKDWRDQNPKIEGNIRDYSTVEQLVVLAKIRKKPKMDRAENDGAGNLRDHMTDAELVFTALAELSTRQIAETMETKGLEENKIPAKKGGRVARNARLELEQKTGKRVTSKENYLPNRQAGLPSKTKRL